MSFCLTQAVHHWHLTLTPSSLHQTLALTMEMHSTCRAQQDLCSTPWNFTQCSKMARWSAMTLFMWNVCLEGCGMSSATQSVFVSGSVFFLSWFLSVSRLSHWVVFLFFSFLLFIIIKKTICGIHKNDFFDVVQFFLHCCTEDFLP